MIRDSPYIDSIVLESMSGLAISSLILPALLSNITFHEYLLRPTWAALKERICCTRWWHASEWLLSVGELRISRARFWPTAPIRGPISSKRRHRACLDGPCSLRHATPCREAWGDAVGALGETALQDSNAPQEAFTIEGQRTSEP
jgi:hypothetical protein